MSSSTVSVDDIAGSLWSAAVSEHAAPWEYETFLHEVTSAAFIPSSSSSDPSSKAPPVTPDDYHAYLKSQLDRACAAVAVARSRVPSTKPGESSKSESRDDGDGHGGGASTMRSASDDAPVGIPALPPMLKNSAVQVKQINSESSREDSDDDELEGDTGTTGNQDPVEVKRFRRMESNRESARRSRRRKQEHMTELETQVGQLKVEHTTLLKRQTDVNQKYDKASVDNRILKADIETLRAKVKMAEETVKRVTGINPLLLAMSSMPNTSIPFMSSSLDSFSIPTLPMQPNPRHQSFNHPPTIDAMSSQPSRLVGNFHNPNNSNPLPPAVGNLQNRVVNNAPQISNVPNIDGSVAMWGPDIPHSQSQKH